MEGPSPRWGPVSWHGKWNLELAVIAIEEVGAVLVKVQHIQKADTFGHQWTPPAGTEPGSHLFLLIVSCILVPDP